MRAIIRYMQEKLKSWIRNDQVFYGLLLILVGLGSFSLGRLSLSTAPANKGPEISFISSKALPPKVSDIKPIGGESAYIKTSDTKSSESSESSESDLSVVASKSGTKYHLPECAGAKQIKPDNLVTFTSRAEAEQAGYTPAANCPGLQ